ncbi:immediate early response gene 2 protein [Oryzias melastigma]|uniref:Immediate early response gene 2 protein-like n=1 Tax=Oryzias melastigma TaxID=30732 RepID=A0A3B3C9M2_ORYME|nr:immediate early response gene 2 protein [Oryzias melastigma]
MEVSAEAKRIMVVALGKLYSSRTQRGGLRLHRSLLLTLVMKSARDIYHAAQPAEESVVPAEVEMKEEDVQPPSHLPDDARNCEENKENLSNCAQHTRKRRSKADADPDFLPCKKAKLEHGSSSEQLLLSSVLVDYVNCGSELGPPPTPIPLQTAIAAC